MSRLRTIRIDLAPVVYERAEVIAAERDIGAADLIRHVFLKWLDSQSVDHPEGAQ